MVLPDYDIFGLTAVKFHQKIIRHQVVWHKPCFLYGEYLGR